MRNGRRGNTLVAPVRVSDRLFLSGLLATPLIAGDAEGGTRIMAISCVRWHFSE